jgi:RNA polymerase sigma factor (sigma-70 family)
LEGEERKALQARLLYFAWRWYRLPRDVAEDIAQTAIVTYLEVAHRYPNREEHPMILIGIFRNKCREHIAAATRAARALADLRSAAETGDTDIPALAAPPGGQDGVLDDLVHSETGRRILRAFMELRPKAREMFRLIVDEGYTRQDLIEYYGLNPNTLDSRLHAYRRELKEVLARLDVDF